MRPTGRSGALAVSLDEFVRYFRSGGGQLWERQSLCKARVITGSPAVRERSMQAVVEATYCKPWQSSFATEIRNMRLKLEETASPRNLKRTAGGTMDTEFIVQMLQLKHGQSLPEIRVHGTLTGLSALEQASILSTSDAEFLRRAYRFQRSTEARIRLMDSSGRHEYPDNPKEQSKLAFLLGYGDSEKLSQEVAKIFREVRETFLKVFDIAEKA